MRAMSVEASPMLSASLEEAETAKTKNIIEMAFDFTAMMWLFAKGSPPKIHRKLETAFAGLGSIRTKGLRSDARGFLRLVYTEH